MATITSPSRLDSTIYLKKELKNYFKGPIDLVDFGSGGLYFLNLLQDMHFKGKYHGLDINPTYPTRVTNLSVVVKKQDILKNDPGKKYPQASCMWVLEHVRDDDKALKIISRSVQIGGHLILAVPSIWSWPVEFGRHGHHYYNFQKVRDQLNDLGFKIEKSYLSSGVCGLIFMMLVNWPRFLMLLFALALFRLHFTRQSNWKNYSQDFISSTACAYTKTDLGVKIHNYISLFTVKIDSQFKIFPQTYIFICKKAN